MLVTEIDRNLETAPEKQVERVVPSRAALSVSPHAEYSELAYHMNRKRGIVLHRGDRRRHDRRKGPVEHHPIPVEHDRRRGGNRVVSSRWSSATHDIVILAVPKDSGYAPILKTGDEVYLEPVALSPSGSEQSAHRPSSPTKSSEGRRWNRDQDYYVHLTTRVR